MLRIRHFIYLLSISFVVFTAYVSSHYSQSYWLVWTALVLSFITLGETFRQRLWLITATGFIMALAVFLVSSISFYIVASAAGLFVVTVGAIYFSQIRPAYFFLALIVNIFIVLAGSFPIGWPFSMERGLLILGGTGVAACLQIIFWPYYVRDEMYALVKRAIRSLERLNGDVFNCLLQPDYPENVYLYERRIHIQKYCFLQSMSELRSIQPLCGRLPADIRSRYVMIMRQLDAIYACILDCALVRWRVSDATVFGVCADELNGILQEMQKILNEILQIALGKKKQLEVTLLEERIRYFEDNYQTVLQVTAKEPLVFLLFLSALRGFCDVAAETGTIKQQAARV